MTLLRKSGLPPDSSAAHSRAVLLVSTIFHAVNDATIAILPGIMPFLVKSFSLTYSDVGLLYGVLLAVMVILQPIMGRLADRFNEIDLLVVGTALISLSCLFLFNVGSYTELFILNMVYSVGASVYHPVSYAVLSRVAEEATYRTKSMGISGAAGDLGNCVAFLSTGIFAGIFGWRFPFLVWGITGSFIVCVHLIILRHVRHLRGSKTVGEVDLNVKSTKRTKSTLRFAVFIFFMCVVTGAIYRTFINFTVLFLTDTVRLSPTDSNYVFSLFVLSGVIGALLSGFITNRLGLRRALIAEFLALSASTLPLYLNFLQVPSAVLPLLVLSGFTLYTTYPAIFSLSADITGFKSRGVSYGFIMSITFIGGVALSFVSGKLADLVSDISIVYIVIAIIALFASSMTYLLSSD